MKPGTVIRDHRYEPSLFKVGIVTSISGRYARVAYFKYRPDSEHAVDVHGIDFDGIFRIGESGIEVLEAETPAEAITA
jgi:hypothetical protein